MLIGVHGRVSGSVSGGCLEKRVISEAQKALLDGQARLLAFDTTDQDDLAFGSSLGCQGKIWIGIECLPAGKLWALETVAEEIRGRRRPAVLLTQILSQGERVVFETAAVYEDSLAGDARNFPDSWRAQIEAVFETRKTRFIGIEMAGSVLIELLVPPVALLLFGAGPDVPPFVKLARDLGHEITVIDRRPGFAVPEQFPGASRVLAAKPHQVSTLLCPDDRTVAVVMNHHYDTDRDILGALLSLELPYLAVLGPRRRTERILSELREGGLMISDATRASIHAPAGLDLGGENPEQIALSILAEIQATLAGRGGGKLKFRNIPIHAEEPAMKKEPCPVPV